VEVDHFGVCELVKNKNHQSPILFLYGGSEGWQDIGRKRSGSGEKWGRNPENDRGVQLTTYVAANSDIEVSGNVVLCQLLPNRQGARYNEHNGYKRAKSSGQPKVRNFFVKFFFFFFRHQQVSTIRASELSSLPLFVVVNEKEYFHTR